jgi:hypothetical protein
MAFTEQEVALYRVREKYGKSGFTEDLVGYRRVGYLRGNRTVSAVGQTWDEAIAALGKKERNGE